LAELPAISYPGLNGRAGSAAAFGRAGFWFQEPKTYNLQSKISKNHGRHYLKAGGEYRRQIVEASRPRPMTFDFRADHTADTFLAPNTRERGDAWATFLLGVIDQNSNISSIPIQRPRVGFWGLFVQDDVKWTQRLTLNLGLRFEYQSAMQDPQNRLSRFLDLDSPIPEFQGAGAPQLPAEAAALRNGPPIFNGAWVFTDEENRNSWDPQSVILLPRAGLAYRLDDRTALRAGYARYAVPSDLTDTLNILGSVPYPGFDATTAGLPLIAGVPQQRLSNPFPGGLVQVVGKSLGRYTNLGGPTTWYNQDFRSGINERFSFSLQRQLPFSIVADITYFMNFGYDHPYTYNVNEIDPRIGYEHKTLLNQSVANPFYNILPSDRFPGQLRTQKTIQLQELLRPYPQYGDLLETVRPGTKNRYQAIQLQFQRPFVQGFNFVVGYNYNRDRNTEFYDEQDLFLENLTWQPGRNPRHRITVASIYELPFGRGRRFLSGAPKIVDAIAGGWALSGIYSYNSGEYLRFAPMLVDGDPTLDNPTRERWFDGTKFARQPAFTRRTNPLQFDDLKGPRFQNLDLTIAKTYRLTERLGFELRMEAYNATNSFMSANPIVDVTLPTFGRITQQKTGFFGRQFQYSGRLRW
ncbi:MAG: TonB-dependent receptor domain-containing protein, partial [Bryobacteraceae bacterium]